MARNLLTPLLVAVVISSVGCNPYVKDFDFPTTKKLDDEGRVIVTADINVGTLAGHLNCPRQELELDLWSSNALISQNHYKVRCPSKSNLWYECQQSSQLYSCKNASGVVFHNASLEYIFE